MQAIIDPRHKAIYISSWDETTPSSPTPIFSPIANSARVCQVESEATFNIAAPLFWTSCTDDVVADRFYYQTNTSTFLVVSDAPLPTTS
jgi:hypothetical protein